MSRVIFLPRDFPSGSFLERIFVDGGYFVKQLIEQKGQTRSNTSKILISLNRSLFRLLPPPNENIVEITNRCHGDGWDPAGSQRGRSEFDEAEVDFREGRGLGWVGQTDLDKWIVNALGALGALPDSVLHMLVLKCSLSPSPRVFAVAGSRQDNVISEYGSLAQLHVCRWREPEGAS